MKISRKPDADKENFFKVVLIGASGVGKSNLLSRYVKNEYDPCRGVTAGVDFEIWYTIIRERYIKVYFWDTWGAERFQPSIPTYYKGVSGALVVYDMTQRWTYDIVDERLKILRAHADKDVSVMLVGNYLDSQHKRTVTSDEAKAFSREHDLLFMETSTKNSTNVQSAFENLLSEMVRKRHGDDSTESTGTNITSETVGDTNRGWLRRIFPFFPGLRGVQEESEGSDIIIRKEEFGALMDKFIPEAGNWIEFGKQYLQVDERELSKIEKTHDGEKLKTEILKLWIKTKDSEATVSRAYELAHKFRNDELEEVFRFLVKLILDAREWKKFAKHGLKLESSVYKEHEDEISSEQKLEMLRLWRRREGNSDTVDKLCIAVRTHFEGNPSMAKDVCNAISGGMNKLCEAVKGISFDVHVKNTGTWNCRDPFIGCQGTTVDYRK